MMQGPEQALSIYLHLPWCVRKCPYCDFNSHERELTAATEKRYLDALFRDIDFELPRIGDRPVETLFFGGGTPSLFSADGLEKLVDYLRARLRISTDIEMTLEANPGTVEAGRFRDYHSLGINRLSLGIQSFADNCLAALGRIHNSDQALRAISTARDAGFDNLNLDLMHGLPGQTLTMALSDLREAIACEPAHISWYQLTIEPNTVFFSRPPALPGDDLCWEIQEAGRTMLAANAYTQYEVSAWARDGRVCRHNLNYWRFGDYLGIGAGAHGKLTYREEQSIRRYQRVRIPESYMHRAGSGTVISEEKVLARDDLTLEFMMNALRLNEGFSVEQFHCATGLELMDLQPALDQALQRQLLLRDGDRFAASEQGLNYLNDLLAIFMPG